ncbi:PREDICTED: uncharacterized protein LOC108378620, partial [Rhagoletis zephyria]|uniref:uncharacterized protein LOC108378620 n=1 Tax=Rhagoletis zephyria TaxID=28612 RepID=UPI0008112965
SLEGASKRFFTDFLQDLPTPGTGGPSFDTTVQTNITGLVGKTVKLTCRVKNLGNRTYRLNNKKSHHTKVASWERIREHSMNTADFELLPECKLAVGSAVGNGYVTTTTSLTPRRTMGLQRPK